MGYSLEIRAGDTVSTDDKSWLANRKGLTTARPLTLDLTTFVPAHYTNGFIPSGTVLGRITASGLYGPYSGTTDEVQVLTVGGTGLTSFTVTFGGSTSAAIAAAATAAQVQAALEAMPSIGAGNISVSGNAGGPWTLTFLGTLADADRAQVTTTPTGGSGTVTPTTTTAGGTADTQGGLEVARFLMLNAVEVVKGSTTLTRSVVAGLWEGIVRTSKLPKFTGTDNGMLDAAAQAALPNIRFE